MENKSLSNIETIESNALSIQECLRSYIYEIPNFQRPYSWENDQLNDFWTDINSSDNEFFLGSTVTWIKEKRPLFNDLHSVIDGQQRLTTCTILLSTIRDYFHEIETSSGNEEIKKIANTQFTSTQNKIIVTDDDGESHRVLIRKEDLFYEKIQRPNAIPSNSALNASATRIEKARIFFEEKINDEINSLNEEDKISKLKQLRSNVLASKVIQVELNSEEDGFLVFETLNTRGADLRLADLVKNLLVRESAKNGDDRATVSKRWENFSEKIQGSSTDFDLVDRFIWQSWNSRRKAVKQQELYSALIRHFKNTDSSSNAYLDYLEELEVDSEIYIKFDNENIQPEPQVQGVRNAFSVPQFVDSVRALSIFNVSVANSAMIAIARKYNLHKKFTKANLIKVARDIENFHFQFSALNNSGSTGGTRTRYNNFALELENAKNAAEFNLAVENLSAKLRASLPDNSKTTEIFSKLFYAPNLTLRQADKNKSRKAFITYVLLTISKHFKALPPAQSISSWSIEHIKPQSKASKRTSDPIYSIGNLTLLTTELNSEISDGDFADKHKQLKDAITFKDEEIKKWFSEAPQEITSTHIEERSKYLSTLALEKIWNIG